MGTQHEGNLEGQRERSSGAAKPNLRPNQDQDANIHEERQIDPIPRREPRGVEKHIADADEKARDKAGTREPVRNHPPAGKWNETAD